MDGADCITFHANAVGNKLSGRKQFRQMRLNRPSHLVCKVLCRNPNHISTVSPRPGGCEILRSTCPFVRLSMSLPQFGLYSRISQKRHVQTSRNFCTCFLWPWLSLHLTSQPDAHNVLRCRDSQQCNRAYVMYFRFYG